MQDRFKTIEAYKEGLYKEKGSKFLAFAHPVEQEQEVVELISGYKKKYHDARHHCYAYRLGQSGDVFKTNDDNEPVYTAGKPILGQIDSFGLTNILVVVVRYFGGTLLGRGGLVNAYKNAAFDALDKAKVIEKTINDYYEITCQYDDIDKIMRILKEDNINIHEQGFEVLCKMKISIPSTMVEKILGKMKLIKTVNLVYLYTA